MSHMKSLPESRVVIRMDMMKIMNRITTYRLIISGIALKKAMVAIFSPSAR